MTGIWWRHQGDWRYPVMQRNVHDNKVTGCKASVEVEFRRPPCWKHPTSWFCKRHKLKVKAWATGKKPGSPQQPQPRHEALDCSWLLSMWRRNIKHHTKAFLSRTLCSNSRGASFRPSRKKAWQSHCGKSFGPTVRGYSRDIPILTNGMNTIRACKCTRQFLPGV